VARDKDKKRRPWDGKERRDSSKVLVVNDDTGGCELIVRVLSGAGFEAQGVNSQQSALEKLGEMLPRCVVLDLAAGGIGSSLKLLDNIRSHHDERVSSTRAILVANSSKNRDFSFQSGADAFVTRPFHANDLVTSVHDVLDRPDEERARHRRDQLNQ
jgi:DNA-binding response OmpR family regulator